VPYHVHRNLRFNLDASQQRIGRVVYNSNKIIKPISLEFFSICDAFIEFIFKILKDPDIKLTTSKTSQIKYVKLSEHIIETRHAKLRLLPFIILHYDNN